MRKISKGKMKIIAFVLATIIIATTIILIILMAINKNLFYITYLPFLGLLLINIISHFNIAKKKQLKPILKNDDMQHLGYFGKTKHSLEEIIQNIELQDNFKIFEAVIGICGEVGEYANLVKKKYRDNINNIAAMKDEIADIFIYTVINALFFNIDLREAVMDKLMKNESKRGEKNFEYKLRELTKKIHSHVSTCECKNLETVAVLVDPRCLLLTMAIDQKKRAYYRIVFPDGTKLCEGEHVMVKLHTTACACMQCHQCPLIREDPECEIKEKYCLDYCAICLTNPRPSLNEPYCSECKEEGRKLP